MRREEKKKKESKINKEIIDIDKKIEKSEKKFKKEIEKFKKGDNSEGIKIKNESILIEKQLEQIEKNITQNNKNNLYQKEIEKKILLNELDELNEILIKKKKDNNKYSKKKMNEKNYNSLSGQKNIDLYDSIIKNDLDNTYEKIIGICKMLSNSTIINKLNKSNAIFGKLRKKQNNDDINGSMIYFGFGFFIGLCFSFFFTRIINKKQKKL